MKRLFVIVVFAGFLLMLALAFADSRQRSEAGIAVQRDLIHATARP
jgi:hypothetical protein